jgi:hypothetical protein
MKFQQKKDIGFLKGKFRMINDLAESASPRAQVDF